MQSAPASNSFSPSLCSVDDSKPQHQKIARSASSRKMEAFGGVRDARAAATGLPSGESTRKLVSTAHLRSAIVGECGQDDSANVEGSKDAWAELKVNLVLQMVTRYVGTDQPHFFLALSRGADQVDQIGRLLYSTVYARTSEHSAPLLVDTMRRWEMETRRRLRGKGEIG